MARRTNPVTKIMIRKYFGKHARVSSRWFKEGYKVTVPTGEVIVTDAEVTVVIGGDDIHRAATLLMREMWGSITAYGDRESIMTWMAHGEAWGVNVQPGIKRGWFWRTVIAAFFLDGVIEAASGNNAGVITAAIAILVWWLANRSHKRKVQQLAAEVSYRFPRVHGTTNAASNENLERDGWL